MEIYYESKEDYLKRAEIGILELFTEEERFFIYQSLFKQDFTGNPILYNKIKNLAFRFGESFQEMTPELEVKYFNREIEKIKNNPEWIKKVSKELNIPIPKGWIEEE